MRNMSTAAPKLDQAQHKRLLSTIKEKLKASGGDDDVLPEYMLVMLQNGKTKEQVAAELVAFLGHQSNSFADWLWQTCAAVARNDTNMPPLSSERKRGGETSAAAPPNLHVQDAGRRTSHDDGERHQRSVQSLS